MKNTFTSVLFLICTASASAQWTDDTAINTLVSDSAYVKEYPTFVDDNLGGYFVVWTENRVSGLIDGDVYAQHIDANGLRLWGEGGVLVCSDLYLQYKPIALPDGEGGIFVAWTDNRNNDELPGLNNYQPALARVDESGNVLWSFILQEDANYNFQTQSFPITMMSDGEGGVFVCWNTLMPLQNVDVLMQRVDADGNTLWDNNLNITPIADSQYESQIVTDGSGGCYVGWLDERNGDGDYYVQHVDADGNIQWQESGLPLVVETNNNNNTHRLLSDGQQGAYVVYCRRIGSSAPFDVYAQRMSPDGEPMWGNEAGISVSSADDFQMNIEATTDGAGNLFAVWEDLRNPDNNNEDIYAQKVNSSGIVQWTTDGVLALDGEFGDVVEPNIVHDGQGGAIVCAQKHNVLNDDIAQLQAANITSAGTLNGSVMNVTSSNTSFKWFTSLLPTVTGQCITLFTEERYEEQDRLYLQKTAFTPYSSVYEIVSDSALQLWPNPCSEVLNVRSDMPVKNVQVINARGEVVQNFSNTNNMDVSTLASGLYVLMTEAGIIRFIKN
ncbi:MAG: T9SS type A sorting domain-containing protein [Flavobacteriales bacterium]